MKRVDSLIRDKNVMFFISLNDQKTSKGAARVAKLSPQHGRKLIRIWVEAGWVEKKPTLHGSKYFLTAKGQWVKEMMAKVLSNV